MSSWEAIENQSYLSSITVMVNEAVHHDDNRLDWRLTVEDASGKEFKLEIWQKHDPLTEWEEGVEYEIRNAFGQAWAGGKKLHSSKKWSTERTASTHDCRLMVMGDSHVGRKKHPSNPYQPIDCAGKFKQAVETAISHDADCIIHTGDVFHDSATEEDCDTVHSAFELMENQGIKFYYILGNHECERGNDLLRWWEQRGVAIHLEQEIAHLSPDVRLFGYDHRPESQFSLEEMNLPDVLINLTGILVLHQTLVLGNGSGIDLNEMNDRTAGGFEHVFAGHLHDPDQPDWSEGNLLYAGSTEDLSSKTDPSDPSVWFLNIKDGMISSPRRQKL